MIDILTRNGDVRCSIELNKGAVGKFSLMENDYIELPFSLLKPVYFQYGDYVDMAEVLDERFGGKFANIYEVVDLVMPTYNSKTGGYDYTLRLDAYYYKWKNKVFKYTPEEAGREASWTLTATLDVHLDVFLRNLKALGYQYRGVDFEYVIDDSVEKASYYISYDNTNLIDALTTMAETWDTEWWMADSVIHFGRCEFGDAVNIENDIEAQSITRSESSGTYATRVYAFGAERNLPSNYRETDNTDILNGVVQRRLMLPEGTPYLDAYRYDSDGNKWSIGTEEYDALTSPENEMPEEEAVEDVVTFDEIYPRTTCVVGDVGTYDSTVTDEDTGEKVTETFYYVSDTSGFKFDSSYILPNETLMMVFSTGKLCGMEFEVQFRKAGTSIGTTKLSTDVYELVQNEDYGRKLPDDILHPETGDEFVLYNWDSTKIADTGIIDDAEQELLEYATDYVKKRMIDDGTYTVKLASDWVYKDQVNRTYEIGQKIRLIHKGYFTSQNSIENTNYRLSRIIGYEINLDIPWDSPTYTVGESLQYSRIGELQSDIDGLIMSGQKYAEGTNGGGVYLIRTNDATAASNSNAYSALRALAMFLRRDADDTAQGNITFQKAVEVMGSAAFDDDASVAGIAKSDNFRTGDLLGVGWGAYKTEAGDGVIETDRLIVRKTLQTNTLVINQISFYLGENVFSCGGFQITEVEEEEDGWKCYYDTQDGQKFAGIAVDDLVRCQRYNEDTTEVIKYYWRRVTDVGDGYVTISREDCDEGSAEPEIGDNVVQFGNATDKTRQSLIMIDARNGGAVEVYAGIDSYNLTDKNMIGMGTNSATGESYLYGYGEMYFGDRNTSEGNYITYQDGKMYINATVRIGEGSEGLSNLSDWATARQQIQTSIDNLQNQIDDVIETWSYPYTPTTENYPASEWDTETLRRQHIGDVFYVIQDKDSDETTENVGTAWRWYWVDETDYGWVQVSDSEAALALEMAKKSVVKIQTEYYLSTSREEPTGGEWQTTPPEREKYTYIWSRTTTYYGDNTSETSEPVCITGYDGEDALYYEAVVTPEQVTINLDGTMNVDEVTIKFYRTTGDVREQISLRAGATGYYGTDEHAVTCANPTNEYSSISIPTTHSTYGTLAKYYLQVLNESGVVIAEKWYYVASAVDIQAQTLVSKAVTDGFTSIEGGLILTQIIRLYGLEENGTTKETAGISGITNATDTLPAFWAGGTYEEAMQQEAGAAIYHDGSAKFGLLQVEARDENGDKSGTVYSTLGATDNTMPFYLTNKDIEVENFSYKERTSDYINEDVSDIASYYPTATTNWVSGNFSFYFGDDITISSSSPTYDNTTTTTSSGSNPTTEVTIDEHYYYNGFYYNLTLYVERESVEDDVSVTAQIQDISNSGASSSLANWSGTISMTGAVTQGDIAAAKYSEEKSWSGHPGTTSFGTKQTLSLIGTSSGRVRVKLSGTMGWEITKRTTTTTTKTYTTPIMLGIGQNGIVSYDGNSSNAGYFVIDKSSSATSIYMRSKATYGSAFALKDRYLYTNYYTSGSEKLSALPILLTVGYFTTGSSSPSWTNKFNANSTIVPSVTLSSTGTYLVKYGGSGTPRPSVSTTYLFPVVTANSSDYVVSCETTTTGIYVYVKDFNGNLVSGSVRVYVMIYHIFLGTTNEPI